MRLSKKLTLLCSMIYLVIILTACGNKELENAYDYILPVDEIAIPDYVQIIGFGEATHGNSEFQQLKKDVFKVLLENENVRVFVLEADFGGGQQINDFILNGNGTARDSIEALDYGIY